MRTSFRALTACCTIVALLALAPARAFAANDQHVVDAAILQQAVADRLATDAAHRETINGVLATPEVQAVAAELGLDLADARSAIATLNSDELARVAAHATAVQADLAGGQATIVISVTTLLLIIIIVLLVAD